MGSFEKHILHAASNASHTSSCQHVRNVEQIRHAVDVHHHLTLVFKLPEKDYDARINIGFHILQVIVTNIENMGPMKEDFIRKLFSMGEQTLRHLEAAINRRHGNQNAIDIAKLGEGFQPYSGKCTTSQKEKRHLRHSVIVASVAAAFNMPIDSAKRVTEAGDAVRMCSGEPLKVTVQNSGLWNLPRVTRKDEKWEAEMHYYAVKAVPAAAQCLGYGFMRWPVDIWGQTVPGTGSGVGVLLRDWEALEEQE